MVESTLIETRESKLLSKDFYQYKKYLDVDGADKEDNFELMSGEIESLQSILTELEI